LYQVKTVALDSMSKLLTALANKMKIVVRVLQPLVWTKCSHFK